MLGPAPVPRSDTVERSLLTLKRAGFKLGVFVLCAGAQALAGYGFIKPLSTMALWTALICAAIATVRQERATDPFYNALDEAAWFYLLGFVLRRLV